MGSKVFANGLAVATTTSGHIASNKGEYDIRLKGKEKVERLSYLESTDLKKDRSQTTTFDEGWVWREPSECGAPSKSKADDKLPGTKNGAVVNGKIMVAPGAGSPNVFVEHEKVECHTHLTRQNMGGAANSPGVIMDAAEFAQEIEEYDRRQEMLKALAEAARRAAAEAAALERARQLAASRENPAPPAKVTPEALAKLGIEGVIVSDDDASRIQGLDTGPCDPKLGSGPYLEVIATSTVTIEVLGPGAAKAFIQTPAGEKKGPKASYTTGDGAFRNLWDGLGDLVGGAAAGTATVNPLGTFVVGALKDSCGYRQETITVTGSSADTGSFTREVFVFPPNSAAVNFETAGVGKLVAEGKRAAARLVSFFERFDRLKGAGADIKLEFFSGKISLEGKWDEESAKNSCAYYLGITPNFYLIKASIEVRFPLENIFPAAKVVVTAIKELASFLGIPVKGLYFMIKVFGEVSVVGNFGGKGYRSQRKPVERKGTIYGRGKFGVNVGLALQLTEAVKASCGLEGYFDVRYPLVPKAGPLDLDVKIDLVANFEVKFGFFKIGGERRIPLAAADLA